MGEFWHTFTATHLVSLAASAAAVYVAKTFGRRFGRSVVELNDNLKHLNSTILKTEILWEKHADASMWADLERREKKHAAL
jgi:hypothetical protein